MSRDGSGNYTLPVGNPVVTNTIISSGSWANPTLSDIASALTQSLSRDGQTTPTADLTMGNFKLRNLANALARTDAVPAGQVQDGGLTTLSSVSGTDTITASSAPAITAYATGQCFDFIAAGANTTTSVTLNINGLGAKSVTKYGANALAIGNIQNGQSVRVRYDGTQFQVISPITSGAVQRVSVYTRIGGVQQVSVNGGAFTSTGATTFNPLPTTTAVDVEVQGGGAAGGGTQVASASQNAAAAGGASGSYARGWYTTGFSGVTVTVGAGGLGVSNANGGAGGASSFGALATAPGGAATSLGLALVPQSIGGGSVSGAIASGGNIVNSTGAVGVFGICLTLGQAGSGSGGASIYGGGGGAQSTGSGNTAQSPGAGGGGGFSPPSGGPTKGGDGGQGIVIVREY